MDTGRPTCSTVQFILSINSNLVQASQRDSSRACGSTRNSPLPPAIPSYTGPDESITVINIFKQTYTVSLSAQNWTPDTIKHVGNYMICICVCVCKRACVPRDCFPENILFSEIQYSEPSSRYNNVYTQQRPCPACCLTLIGFMTKAMNFHNIWTAYFPIKVVYKTAWLLAL
jgi:hypothetical protein